MRKSNIKIWELSLLIALCITLCQASAELSRQNELSGKIIRLHVIASSDSPEDQALKLRVRDAIVPEIEALMSDAENAADAGEIIEANRTRLLAAAGESAGGEKVELIWGRESYGPRHTSRYSLPAGEYSSLRVIIGEGQGQNWWGVIFPQLDCSGGYVEAAEYFSEEEISLIFEEEGVELRFRFLEILESLRLLLCGK